MRQVQSNISILIDVLIKLPDIIREIRLMRLRWAGHVECTGRGTYRDLVGKPKVRRQLGRSRRK
jgi:hypothetical protein